MGNPRQAKRKQKLTETDAKRDQIDETLGLSTQVHRASEVLTVMEESLRLLGEEDDALESDYRIRMLSGIEVMAGDLSERLDQVAERLFGIAGAQKQNKSRGLVVA